MPWTPPTVNDFLARYPAYTEVQEETIQVFLDEAVSQVGDTWIERDRTPAVLHLTAHTMASEGVGASMPGAGGSTPGTGAVKRRKVGDVEVEFYDANASPASTGSGGNYSTTSAGQRYLELLRKNFPAVAVV